MGDSGIRRLFALVVVATAFAVSGCGARVPQTFDPSPPRLALETGDIEVADHTDDDEVVILLFGDSGTGSDDQAEVGRLMIETCRDAGCDLALTFGDNIYRRGVRAPNDDGWDPAFINKFEEPYEGFGRFDIWMVAGNHDWFRGRESVDTEILYTRQSERWRMLSYDYEVPRLPDWLHVYALDTTIIDNGVEIGQIDRAEAALCGAEGWRILMGHHAIFTSGRHANGDGEIPSIKRALLPVIGRCDVQLYLAGHDHHQEHIVADGFDQIIQGAAGGTRNVGDRSADDDGTQLFRGRKFGFGVLRVRRDSIDVTFYGYAPGNPEGFDVIYEATIDRGR